MKANFKFVLHGPKDKTGCSRIFLRVTTYYSAKYTSTGRKVQPQYWNRDKEEVRSSHPDSVIINEYLSDFMRVARDRFRQGGFNINAISRPVTVDVLTFLDRVIKDYGRPEQFRTRKKYVTLKNKLIAFTKSVSIPFSILDKTFIQEFDSFLRLSHGNKLNTRLKYLAALKRVVNLAIEQEIPASPFPKLRMREERTEKRFLSIDEIKMLQAYDAPMTSQRWHARNLFLFSFYTAGGRFGDIVSLEWRSINHNTLRYTQEKTGKHFSIGLIPEAQAIISLYSHRAEHKYVFPFLPEALGREDIVRFKSRVSSANAFVNKKLAVIANHLNMPRFSFHASRRSVSDFLRKRNVDLYTISHALGHSSLAVTERYLRQTDDDFVSDRFANAFKEEHDG